MTALDIDTSKRHFWKLQKGSTVTICTSYEPIQIIFRLNLSPRRLILKNMGRNFIKKTGDIYLLKRHVQRGEFNCKYDFNFGLVASLEDSELVVG